MAPRTPVSTPIKVSVKPAAKAVKPVKAAAPLAPEINEVIILSPGAELTAAEAELRLRTVARHLKVTNLPPVLRVAEIDANPDATAFALYRAFRAVGRGGPALYLVAGSAPHSAAAAASGTLSLLQTDWGNTFLAPNDGTLGLLASLLRGRGIPHTLHLLDEDAITAAEQARMQNPDWLPALDFPLRDLLAPAAAALLAGVPAARLAQVAPTTTQPGAARIHATGFVAALKPLPLKLNESISVHAVATGNGAHGSDEYLLSVTLDPLDFDQLRDDRARFVLRAPRSCRWLQRLLGDCKHTITVSEADANRCPTGSHATACGHCGPAHHARHHKRCTGNQLHLSPFAAPGWDERFLSVRLSGRCRHNLLSHGLTLTRVR